MKKYLSFLLVFIMIFSLAGSALVTASEPSASGQPYKAVQVAAEEEADETLHDVADSKYFDVKSPSIFSTYTEPENKITEGDLYVSTQGDDVSGDGSFEKPFATINRARDEIRDIKSREGLPEGGITVSVMAGRYQMSEPIRLDSDDSGTEESPIMYTAYGDGEVLFTGALSLRAEDFTEAGDNVKAVLTEDAAQNVRMINLKKYGITSSMLTLSPIGVNGRSNVEFYFNRENFRLARYLQENEFAYTRSFIGNESGGAVFGMKNTELERVKSWSSLSDIWVLGMFYYEYQDSTSSVTFDLDNGTFQGKRISVQDESTSYRYFFYNVLDELDEPGEWYLDRKNCILYMYPTGDMSEAELDLTVKYSNSLVNISNCDYITLKGFSFMGTKGNGLYANNVNHFSLLNCNFGEIGGQAVSGSGENNLIRGCSIEYVGRGGINFSGGDKDSLSKAYNVIDNNYISHWGLNARVFTTAIDSFGQGNTVSHNEIAYSTSNSLGVSGNNNIVEYNLIHDCTTYANDCGSFYNGSSWTSGGNILRYNCFYNIGSDEVKPSAIYWDDGMAYQTAYGNLFVNIAGYALSIGGGFGNTVVNNVIINTGYSPVLYDDRPYMGYRVENQFYTIGGFLWNIYKRTPYNDRKWRENFPLLSQILQNSKDIFAPHFAFNPAFSLFSDNIYVNKSASSTAIAVINPSYSTDIDNYSCRIDEMDKVFVDPSHGDYRISEDSEVWDTVTDFEPIPYYEIGRY